jgi:hypothetical protein
VIDVFGPSLPEQWLQERVDEDAGIEHVVKTVQRILTTCELEQ